MNSINPKTGFTAIMITGAILIAFGIHLVIYRDTAASTNALENFNSRASNSINQPKQIEIPMNEPWTNSGIEVKTGQLLIITASGKGVWKNIARSNPNAVPAPYEECGPEGTAPNSKDYFSNIYQYQTKEANKGALIGRIGMNGAAFKIGSGFRQVVNQSGVLYLGINDMKQEIDSLSFNDNSGAFRATIEVGSK